MCFSIRSLSMLSDATRIGNNSPHFYCHFVIVYSPHDAEVNVTNVDNENAKTIAQFISIAIGEKKRDVKPIGIIPIWAKNSILRWKHLSSRALELSSFPQSLSKYMIPVNFIVCHARISCRLGLECSRGMFFTFT